MILSSLVGLEIDSCPQMLSCMTMPRPQSLEIDWGRGGARLCNEAFGLTEKQLKLLREQEPPQHQCTHTQQHVTSSFPRGPHSAGLLTPQGTFTIYLETTQFLPLEIKT